jgi:hypothetical protein
MLFVGIAVLQWLAGDDLGTRAQRWRTRPVPASCADGHEVAARAAGETRRPA